MAFTPTDPAKAEVRFSGQAPNIEAEFYIPAGPKGDIGAAGPPTTLTVLGTATGTNDPTPYELRGEGMPNGARSASPGTYYTDMLGTNGAWRWLKKTGTGNTGWVVVIGDTGKRDITSLMPAGVATTGKLTVHRIDNTIYYGFEDLTFGGLSTTRQYVDVPLPLGFAIAVVYPGTVYAINGGEVASSFIRIDAPSGGGTLKFQGVLSSTWLRDIKPWPTKADWPTTLPGIPV